jgi:pilus assembly protein CpaB
MKPKTMILMVVAIGCGLVASYMTSQLLAERGNTEAEPQEKVMVLVAKQNLEMGLLVKDPKQYFKEKAFIKGEEPSKAYTDKDYDQLKDRRLVNRLAADQFVSADDLQDKNKNSLSARLPKGMRAVGLKVNIEQIAGGFASLPMSRVDIISVLRRGDDDSVSQTILENVLVLAADDNTQRAEGKNAMPANTVTVALTPEDAELVALAQEMGSLKLVLRADGDSDVVRTRGVEGSSIRKKRLLAKRGSGPKDDDPPSTSGSPLVDKVQNLILKNKGKPTVAEEPKARPEPKTQTHILTIYNGDQGRRYPFKLDRDGKLVNEEITATEPEAEPKPEPKKPNKPAEPKKADAPKTDPKAPSASHG